LLLGVKSGTRKIFSSGFIVHRWAAVGKIALPGNWEYKQVLLRVSMEQGQQGPG
jgi:hypothetical protein